MAMGATKKLIGFRKADRDGVVRAVYWDGVAHFVTDAGRDRDERWRVVLGRPVFEVEDGAIDRLYSTIVADERGEPVKSEPAKAVSNIELGCCVVLRSGGERMTVTAVRDNTAWVCWHDQDGHHQDRSYSLKLLHRVPGVHELDSKELADVARALLEGQ